MKVSGPSKEVMSSIKPTFKKVADMMGGVNKPSKDAEPTVKKPLTRPAAEGLKRAPRLKFKSA